MDKIHHLYSRWLYFGWNIRNDYMRLRLFPLRYNLNSRIDGPFYHNDYKLNFLRTLTIYHLRLTPTHVNRFAVVNVISALGMQTYGLPHAGQSHSV